MPYNPRKQFRGLQLGWWEPDPCPTHWDWHMGSCPECCRNWAQWERKSLDGALRKRGGRWVETPVPLRAHYPTELVNERLGSEDGETESVLLWVPRMWTGEQAIELLLDYSEDL